VQKFIRLVCVRDKNDFSAGNRYVVGKRRVYKAKKLAKYSDLQQILGKELPIHTARLKFMVLLIITLVKGLWGEEKKLLCMEK